MVCGFLLAAQAGVPGNKAFPVPYSHWAARVSLPPSGGRIDDQIKLHGYRIELAEIDAAISALPGVRAGATVALRRPDGAIVRLIGFAEPAGRGDCPHAPSTGLQPLPAGLADRKQLERLYLETRLSKKPEPQA